MDLSGELYSSVSAPPKKGNLGRNVFCDACGLIINRVFSSTGTEAEGRGRLSLPPRLVGRGEETGGAALCERRAAAHAEGSRATGRTEEDNQGVPDCCGDPVGILGGEKEAEPRRQPFRPAAVTVAAIASRQGTQGGGSAGAGAGRRRLQGDHRFL